MLCTFYFLICRNIQPSERKSCETYKTRHRQRSSVNRIICYCYEDADADVSALKTRRRRYSVINPVRQ